MPESRHCIAQRTVTQVCHQRRHRWVALIFANLLLVCSVQADTQHPVSPPLEMVTAVRETTPLERLYDGTVEAVNQATVSAQTSGRVEEIFFDVNDYVTAGAAIIRFTDVEQQAVLGQTEARLNEAVAGRREAEEEFRRIADLFTARSVSKRDYDRTLAAKDAAVARVKSAESAVTSAEQQVEYTRVRAPYAGIVTERLVEVGESVTVGQPLISGLSLEQLRVVVDLPQDVMMAVRVSNKAVIITGEERVPCEQITIFPFADPVTNTFKVRLDLPTGQFGLYPGMFVKVAFAIGESQRLLIPAAALLRRSEVTAVYVANDSDRFRLRQVRIGNLFGDRIEVLAGLTAGERIALDPVRAGIQVKSTVVPGVQ